MRMHLALAAAFVTMLGCGDPSRSTDPATALAAGSGPLASASHPHASESERLVSMMDACDPTTFNAVIGPGTCVRQGGVTFAEFIAELTRTRKAGSWHNAPPSTTGHAGQTLLAVNRGGEVHTFTRVAVFGGGIVPPLNALSGNPVVAPECNALVGSDFVAAGATFEEEIGAAGTHRFQCCIHPWMRTTVRAQ